MTGSQRGHNYHAVQTVLQSLTLAVLVWVAAQVITLPDMLRAHHDEVENVKVRQWIETRWVDEAGKQHTLHTNRFHEEDMDDWFDLHEEAINKR